MKILSFDLELNQSPNGPKIIEIGACIGETTTSEVVDSYTVFINPKEQLTPEIITLTSITQADVDKGADIEEAYLGFRLFAAQHECESMPLVWGLGDGHALRKELPKGEKWVFGRRELDVKAVYQAYQMSKGQNVQAGLAKAMTKLGMSFKGRKHRANDDAINTFLIYCELLSKFE